MIVSGSGESWFEPRRGNRPGAQAPGLCCAGGWVGCQSERSPPPQSWLHRAHVSTGAAEEGIHLHLNGDSAEANAGETRAGERGSEDSTIWRVRHEGLVKSVVRDKGPPLAISMAYLVFRHPGDIRVRARARPGSPLALATRMGEFLQRLRVKDKRPTPRYYYRELPNLRDL